MAHNYIHTMFGPGALARQQAAGSRASYARMAADADGTPDMMGEAEAAFIAARDSFYIALLFGLDFLQVFAIAISPL